jgi:hypothetical protein
LYSYKIKWFGVKNLIYFNHALLEKWLWCYATEREGLWRLVVETKYDSLKGAWCIEEVASPFSVGVWMWMYIRKGWEVIFTFVIYEVGDGFGFGLSCGVRINH